MNNLGRRTLELIRDSALFYLVALRCEYPREDVLDKMDDINELLKGVDYQLELIEEEYE